MLLQAGQLLSRAGTQTSAIAYPLLVLALSGSAARAGAVGFARLVPAAVFAVPSGVAADRWNRKWLMIGADGIRALAVGGLAAAVLAGRAAFWAILLAAFVEGAGAALFAACSAGAVRAVVSVQQLPAATAAQTGREAAVQVAGPPLGGALFGLSHALPFLVDAASYVFSSASLVAMRAPFQERRETEASTVRARLVEGFRFTWSRPFLRTCAFLFGLTNFLGPGLLLALVVIGTRQGLSGGAVGVLVAAFGASLLLGSLLSAFVRRALPIRAVLLLELWTWLGSVAFLVWPDVYVLAASLLPTALAVPSTDSVVHGYRIAMTPDRLLGRAEAVTSTIALAIAPLGPLAAGALLGTVSPRATVAVFAGFGLVLALWGTLSPSIRSAPSLDELVPGEAVVSSSRQRVPGVRGRGS
jgi:predicted MFS family arabinose efflux permease